MTDPVFRQSSEILTINTDGQGLFDVTRKVERWLETTDIVEGVLTLFCRHTSASLLIQENAAPAVQRDMALTSVSVQIPIFHGRPRLGTWQGIYLFEHRRRPHRREIAMHAIGMTQ